MASPEAGPFARTGGLGDVMAALPDALARLGHEVKVFLPAYGNIDRTRHNVSDTGLTVEIPHNGRTEVATLSRARLTGGAEYYFIGHDDYFDREAYYLDPDTGKDYPDNDLRFAFFSRAVIETARKLELTPDIIHVHDWQAALISVYLKTIYADDPLFAATRTVLTIHNLGYQGLFDGDRFKRLDLPPELFYAATGALEYYTQVNFLKGGIVTADKITTVSRKYAEEIISGNEFGCGLEGVLKDRSEDLVGILNGVDYTTWSPSRDRLIPFRYRPTNLSGKKATKVELMREAGLPLRDRVPLVAVISRLADQKGIDLIAKAADGLFALGLQMIILGTGEEKYHRLLTELQERYPDQLKLYLKFDDRLAHTIEAGADIFLMPSRYEPCGLNQMYSLKYGTVPVVRKTGGLADTVSDYDINTGEGTGFVFDEYRPEAMLIAVARAVKVFGRRTAWSGIMKAGMALDFSWQRAALAYLEAVYQA